VLYFEGILFGLLTGVRNKFCNSWLNYTGCRIWTFSVLYSFMDEGKIKIWAACLPALFVLKFCLQSWDETLREGRNWSCVSKYWQISVNKAHTVNQWTWLQPCDLSPWMGNQLSYCFPTGISKNIIRFSVKNLGIKKNFEVTREIPNIRWNIAQKILSSNW
jgi:hypothetical protein